MDKQKANKTIKFNVNPNAGSIIKAIHIDNGTDMATTKGREKETRAQSAELRSSTENQCIRYLTDGKQPHQTIAGHTSAPEQKL